MVVASPLFATATGARKPSLVAREELQLLIDSGDADALAALSDHTADTDGWDDEFLPGYASGASDDGDLF